MAPRLDARVKIELREHDPAWTERFEALKVSLTDALGSRVLGLEHVGSTSVPELCAKPVLDLLLLVADSTDEASYVEAVESCGYVLRHREPHWFEHRMFKRSEPEANLHVFTAGCEEAERMLRFRDLLRRDPYARGLYACKKWELAARDWSTVQDYADAKTDVVSEILRSL